MFGSGNTPSSPLVEPDRPTGGKPNPREPAGMLEDSLVRMYNNSAPASSSEPGSPEMDAGFQYRAPLASMGAAVEAPPIERFTGPWPLRMYPVCPKAGPLNRAAVSREKVGKSHTTNRRTMVRSFRNGAHILVCGVFSGF